MAERLFQVGIKGVITNEIGNILLLQVEGREGRESFWDLPGGRMDENETFQQTLERELKEEIDCKITGDPEFLAVGLANVTVAYGDSRLGLLLVAYRVVLAENSVITLMDHEIAYDWFEPKKAAELLGYKFPSELVQVISALA